VALNTNKTDHHSITELLLTVVLNINKTDHHSITDPQKANMNGINQHLDKENNVFTNNSKTNSIQECWGEFKEILSQAITTNIPTKMLTSRWNVKH
jgi:hemerythrin-like domain-containing protein